MPREVPFADRFTRGVKPLLHFQTDPLPLVGGALLRAPQPACPLNWGVWMVGTGPVFAQRGSMANLGGGMVRIVADDRENAGGVIAELRKLKDVEVQVHRLALGDFKVEERFAVERKTLADFSLSVLDGRLFKQATALVQAGRRAILMLEGSVAEFGSLAMSRESLQGALVTVSVFFGISVLWTRDAADTARVIVYLARQAQRVARGGLSRFGYRPKGRRARQLFVLQGLPGVGPERATRLLERFGSVQAVATAGGDELVTVAGVGKTTARRIRWALE